MPATVTHFWPGAAVIIDARFSDPVRSSLLDVEEPVQVTVHDPAGAAYFTGVAARQGLGHWQATVPPPSAPGVYKYRVASSGPLASVAEGTFQVDASGVLP